MYPITVPISWDYDEIYHNIIHIITFTNQCLVFAGSLINPCLTITVNYCIVRQHHNIRYHHKIKCSVSKGWYCIWVRKTQLQFIIIIIIEIWKSLQENDHICDPHSFRVFPTWRSNIKYEVLQFIYCSPGLLPKYETTRDYEFHFPQSIFFKQKTLVFRNISLEHVY